MNSKIDDTKYDDKLLYKTMLATSKGNINLSTSTTIVFLHGCVRYVSLQYDLLNRKTSIIFSYYL